jgi:AraC family transcriptional regulator of adaptative response/methylated-DNA-[protein]-cysteine methyltransferase
MAAGQDGIVWLQFGDSAADLEAALLADFPGQPARRDDAGLAAWMGAVCALLADGSADASRAAGALPLDPRGTDFQRQVWSALRAIPRGETRTYTQVAAQIGRPAAVRAVGGACARNSIALLIPCHRVLAAGNRATSAGGLAGFRWGVWRKQKLLAMEGNQHFQEA